MKVTLKTIERITNEICEGRNLDPDTMEFATDIERENEYIVRMYDPCGNNSYMITITKNGRKYEYALTVRSGCCF